MNANMIDQFPQPVHRMMLRLRFFAASVVALACSTGCVVLPIPTPQHKSTPTVTRQNIAVNGLDWIQPGRTTQVEVFLKLGEPDQLSADGRKAAYRWQKVRGYLLIGVPGSGGTEEWLKSHYLVVECDSLGVVTHTQNLHRQFAELSPLELFDDGNVVTSVANEEIVINGPAEWFAGVEGYAWLRNKFWTLDDPPKGRRGQLMLTANRLHFQEQGQFLGGPPALVLRFEDLSECRLDKFGLGRRLVIRARNGEVHTFGFWGPRRIMEDARTTRTACEFIQSKIGP